jgi:hypothetical protein
MVVADGVPSSLGRPAAARSAANISDVAVAAMCMSERLSSVDVVGR